jgi:membrane-bound lytic murein transglycosylase D
MNMAPPEPEPAPATGGRTHTVARGESAWTIARRYGIRNDELLTRNGLDARSVLQPGMELRIDAAPGVAE